MCLWRLQMLNVCAPAGKGVMYKINFILRKKITYAKILITTDL